MSSRAGQAGFAAQLSSRVASRRGPSAFAGDGAHDGHDQRRDQNEEDDREECGDLDDRRAGRLREDPAERRDKRLGDPVDGRDERLFSVRFTLKLLGANAEQALVSAIYGITEPLVVPFRGIFAQPAGTPVVEIATLLSIIFFVLLAALIVAIVRAVTGKRTGSTA